MQSASQHSRLGHNRTGIQMSPIDSAAMQQGVEAFLPPASDRRDDLAVRQRYIAEAEPVGSVPLPGTLTGMVSSAADMITGDRPQAFIDRLGERLAFERGGVRLYEGLLGKMRATDCGLTDDEQLRLALFRDQEQEHFELVADALKSLGADPTAQTPSADLVGVESQGLVQAINDPRTSFSQSLHVMLDAEAIDNVGWEMLIQMANATGHTHIAAKFHHALQQEQQHLVTLRSLFERLSLAEASLLKKA